jgi:predicted nucleic acid-binding protein
LSAITVCPFDRASAKQAALLFEKLSKKGTMINENDLLIAGITLAHGDVLLTRDKKFAYLNEASIQII